MFLRKLLSGSPVHGVAQELEHALAGQHLGGMAGGDAHDARVAALVRPDADLLAVFGLGHGKDVGLVPLAFHLVVLVLDFKIGHALGHGVGLDIHERPVLSPKNSVPLVRSNVVTVEPGIYLAGKFGVRIEDVAVICDENIINLTNSDKNLIEL